MREIISTANNLTEIVRSDPAAENLSAASKAALASLAIAHKDAMSTASNMHANLMVAQRDKLLDSLNPEIFTDWPSLATDIRSAPLDGPVISENFTQKVIDHQAKLEASGKIRASRPTYFKQKTRFHPYKKQQQNQGSQDAPSTSSQGPSRPFRGRGRRPSKPYSRGRGRGFSQRK